MERGGAVGHVPAWAGWPHPEGDLRPGPAHVPQRTHWTGSSSRRTAISDRATDAAQSRDRRSHQSTVQRRGCGQSRLRSRAHAGWASSAYSGGEGEAEVPGALPILWSVGTFRLQLSSKRAGPAVSMRLLSGRTSAEKTSSTSTLLPVRLRWSANEHELSSTGGLWGRR